MPCVKMVEITINKLPYKIPMSWREVTVRQFRDIVRHSVDLNPVRLLSIFTDIDYDELNNYDCSGFDKILAVMDFIGTDSNPENWKRGETITIEGVKIPVIKSIENEKIGQKIMVQNIVNEAVANQKNKSEIISSIVACYYCTKLNANGRWIESEYLKLIETIDNSSVVEAYAEMNFFLSKWLVYAPTNQHL